MYSIFLISILWQDQYFWNNNWSCNTFTDIYPSKPESPSTINTNRKSRNNKPIVPILPIWYLRNHKIQATIHVGNIFQSGKQW